MAVLRKGQHLFNEISKRHDLSSYFTTDGTELPYVNLHKILFYMDDKEFDEIMESIK